MKFITAIFLFLFILIMTSCAGMNKNDIRLINRHNNLCKWEFDEAEKAKVFKKADGSEDVEYTKAAKARYEAIKALIEEALK